MDGMDFKSDATPGAGGPAGIGEVLRRERIAQGLSLFVLAHELNLSVAIIEAVEAEAWDRLPPGRERPHTRQIAERLGVDLESFSELWSQLPGAPEQEPHDPRREFLERVLVSAITVGSVALVLWLVVPGPSLKRTAQPEAASPPEGGSAAWVLKEPAGPYPVVGEVLPEVPVNEEGVLISMRAMDTCEAVVQGLPQGQQDLQGGLGAAQRHTLRISEPWRLRVKGPFTISLDNAGVVALEVAGRRIRHGRTVGEPWQGKFGPLGEHLVPPETAPSNPPTAPETDPADPSTE